MAAALTGESAAAAPRAFLHRQHRGCVIGRPSTTGHSRAARSSLMRTVAPQKNPFCRPAVCEGLTRIPFSSYGVNSTNIRIVSTLRPSSCMAFLPSSD